MKELKTTRAQDKAITEGWGAVSPGIGNGVRVALNSVIQPDTYIYTNPVVKPSSCNM